jgi:hypothetical protein
MVWLRKAATHKLGLGTAKESSMARKTRSTRPGDMYYNLAASVMHTFP